MLAPKVLTTLQGMTALLTSSLVVMVSSFASGFGRSGLAWSQARGDQLKLVHKEAEKKIKMEKWKWGSLTTRKILELTWRHFIVFFKGLQNYYRNFSLHECSSLCLDLSPVTRSCLYICYWTCLGLETWACYISSWPQPFRPQILFDGFQSWSGLDF